MRYRNINFNKGALAFLALLAIPIYNISTASQNALAVTGVTGGETSTTTVEYKQPSVTITINNGQAIQPKTLQSVNGKSASGEIQVPVTVKVENAGAYSIGAHTTNSNLVGKNNASNVIPSTTSAKTLDQLNNTWGYKVGSATTYSPMATSTNTTNIKARTALGKDSATTTTENITLSFGTNINGDLPADTYTGTIVISALAELTTLENVTNMQDVASEHCAATDVGTTVTLTDKRDSKQYLVTKMKDDRCWMSQNLALPGGTVLKSTDSHVTSNYTLPASSKSGFSDDNLTYVYNGTHTSGTIDNKSSNTGAYYSFAAATAGTGTGSSGDMTQDICPKNWRLPTKDEQTALVKTYNSSHTAGGSWDTTVIGVNGTFGQTTFGTHYGVTSADALPGRYLDSGFYYSGTYGLYWSSSINDGTSSYYLYLNSDNGVTSQNSRSKKNGLSVRCILGS